LSIRTIVWMNFVKLYNIASELQRGISHAKAQGRIVGFVPTMGALHEGHLNLIRLANVETHMVVVSIFVNPNQFSDMKDLAAYPRMLQRDMEVLSSLGFETHLFAPEIDQIYPKTDFFQPIDLNGLDLMLEGAFRPGHFQGVVHVIRNLFQIVNPHRAYFGRKDLQQLAVIRYMTKIYNFSVEIVACETLRETSGLALSSRNLRLSDEQRSESVIIYDTLQKVAEWSKALNPKEVKSKAITFFSKGKLRLEYLELVDDLSFTILDNNWMSPSSCCIAAFCGDIRLIDNMPCQ
jgi:pantoate--beta-alanine ligase